MPIRVPTGIYGPLPQGTFGLLMGRSSLTMKGVTVHPGVIDADYQGEIQIMMSAVANISFKKGDRIAQLLILPYFSLQTSNNKRIGGFGSTNPINVFWAQKITQQQPLVTCYIDDDKKGFSALIDTGSDITIVAQQHWPKSKSYSIIPCQVKGISQQPVSSIGRSDTFVTLKGEEGQFAVLKPYVLNNSFSLIGRDTLEQWGAHLEF
nr:protease [Bovine retrovirus CH15]UKS89474.1 protease [Bovine retrovirus CH15]